MPKDKSKGKGLSRRTFLHRAGVAAITIPSAGPDLIGAGPDLIGAGLLASQAAKGGKVSGPGAVPITLRINGAARQLTVEPRVTLLDALRNSLDITGAKKVCDRATCGACTMIVDGKAVYSCTMLAIDAQGRDIQTIEGLSPISSGQAPEGQLHAVSSAFVDHDAQQCGFCTPGFVMACKAYLDGHPHPSEADARHALSGNLCRCGTYIGVRKAVADAGMRMKGGRAPILSGRA